MVLEKVKFKIGTLGKSGREKLEYARLEEARENLGEAYRQCKDITEKHKLKGLECICGKIQDQEWRHKDNIRIGKKLYG